MKKKLLLLVLCTTCLLHTTNIFAGFLGSSLATKAHGTAQTAKWTPNGNFFAVGGANFPDDVIVYGWDGAFFAQKDSASFGSGANDVSWTSDGHYLAVGGNNSTDDVIVYNWDGASLTVTDSQYHGTEANAVAWDPTDSYLAVGGNNNALDLIVYSWDGSTLTPVTYQDFGTEVHGLDWHPDGNFLAVAGNNSDNDVTVYSWNGSTLSSPDTKNFTTEAFAVAWSHDGNYLAAAGNNSSSDLVVYPWSGSALGTAVTKAHGTAGYSVAWSYDDRFVCVGGDNSSSDVAVYAFDGSTLTSVTTLSFGTAAYSVDFNQYSNLLLIAGDNSSSDLAIYDVDAYLNGRSNTVIKNNHHLFNNGGSINGLVQLKNGFTLPAGEWLTVDSTLPFGGGIDLRTTGTLQLEGDLYLDSSASFSTGGYLNGAGNILFLGGDITLPDEKMLYIISDMVIDGQGHTLNLNRRAHLFVDNNVTLTLRNLTLKNTLNTAGVPPIWMPYSGCKLALDNVELAVVDDFWHRLGQLYIHNDVVFTGTSEFVHWSQQQTQIAPHSTWFFDDQTTLRYESTGNDEDDRRYKIRFQDKTSTLHLDGSTLLSSHIGLRLTTGRLLLDNDVTLKNDINGDLSSFTQLAYDTFDSNQAYTVSWNPNGKYIAVGAASFGGDNLRVYEWTNESLAEKKKLTLANAIYGVDWSPDGNYLAVAGYSTTELIVYHWDDPDLTPVLQYTTNDNGKAVSWSPDGNFLAFGGSQAPYDLMIFEKDGSSFTLTTSQHHGDGVRSIDWSPDGDYLVVGGDVPAGGDIRVYSWNGSILTHVHFKDYDNGADGVAWSPDMNYLAVAGEDNSLSDHFTVFDWNGSTLSSPSGKFGGSSAHGYDVKWHPDGLRIFLAWSFSQGGMGYDDVTVFDRTLAIEATTPLRSHARETALSPDANYLAVVGLNTLNQRAFKVFRINYDTTSDRPSFAKGLNFGDEAFGSSSDLNVKILGGARVDIHGTVDYDNAS